MFEKLSLLWKDNAPLTVEYKEFDEMLELNQKMYLKISAAITKGDNIHAMEDEIYSTDVRVNKLERKIRKQLVTHLSMGGGSDVAGCLVLMSIVKDAERMGDLCKNLFEISEMCEKDFKTFLCYDTIVKFSDYVAEVFEGTIKAFDDEDATLAAEIVQDEVDWNRRFDKALRKLAKSDVPADEAVTTTLLIRTLKRLQAHLANISSTIIQPVHRIDHRPKHLRDDSDDD